MTPSNLPRLLSGLLCLILAGIALPAKASIVPLPLTLANDGSDMISPLTMPQLTIHPHPSNPSVAEVAGWVMLPSVVELYKKENSGAEEKPFASSYDTTLSLAAPPQSADDFANALLEYVSGPLFGATNLFALVKDGNNDPSIYIFNISKWDRMSDLYFKDFWTSPVNGSISHLSIYGDSSLTMDPPPTGQAPVPEPVSLIVWLCLTAACLYHTRGLR